MFLAYLRHLWRTSVTFFTHPGTCRGRQIGSWSYFSCAPLCEGMRCFALIFEISPSPSQASRTTQLCTSWHIVSLLSSWKGVKTGSDYYYSFYIQTGHIHLWTPNANNPITKTADITKNTSLSITINFNTENSDNRERRKLPDKSPRVGTMHSVLLECLVGVS